MVFGGEIGKYKCCEQRVNKDRAVSQLLIVTNQTSRVEIGRMCRGGGVISNQ